MFVFLLIYRIRLINEEDFKLLKNLPLLLSIMPLMSQVLAFDSIESVNKFSENLITPSNRPDSENGLKGDISFTFNELVEGVGDVVGNRYWGDFNLEYDAGGGDDLIKKFSLKSRVNNEEQLLFSIPEAYLEHRFGNSRFIFGRKVLDWSRMDANWGFGAINNRVNFDYFEPGQEGLTGIVYDLNKPTSFGKFKLSIFASFLYVPEMNPGQKYDEDTGEVSCQNPWCRPLENSAPVGSNEIPIFYNVNFPNESEVIFRYSFAAKVAFEIGEHFEIEAFAMRKPENNISVTAEIQYQMSPDERIFVDATPQFYYHDVMGGTLNLRPSDNFTVYASALSISPNTFPDGDELYIEYTGLKPQKLREDYLGGGAYYSNDNYMIGLHYIARVSDYDIKDDALVEYPRWNQAANLNFYSRLTSKLSAGLDLKYDMLTEDRLSMINATYQWRKNLRTSLGANIIGTNSKENSFWSDFENNDAVYASMKYLF